MNHTALIDWHLDGDFQANRYSRVHRIRFDGGAVLEGSASPQLVPLPLSSAQAIDPEELFVAALAACHLLWFLDLARQKGGIVTHYRDAAVGEMSRADRGGWWVSKVTLRPDLVWQGEAPEAAVITALHHDAHARCFIANSVKTRIDIVPVPR